jgi:hypothetical protein
MRILIDARIDALKVRIEQAADEREQQIAGLKEVLETRFNGMDMATSLLAENVNRVPTAIDLQVGAAKNLLETRFDGMDRATRLLAETLKQVPTDTEKVAYNLREFILAQVELVAKTTEEKFKAVDALFGSNALALTAALAAQEKAVSEQNKSNTLAITKSEVSTKETIAANAAQTDNSLSSQAALITDLKERIVRIEAGGVATTGARAEQRLDKGSSMATIMAIIASVAILISVITVVALILKK